MRATVLIGFVLLTAARADEPKIPTEQFETLVKAQQKAQKDFSDAYRAAKTDGDREKVSKELGTRSTPDAHAGAFLALMKEHPKDPVTLDVVRWLVSRAAHSPEAGQAVARLPAQHQVCAEHRCRVEQIVQIARLFAT